MLLYILVFSNSSFDFEIIPLEKASNDNTIRNLELGFAIKRVLNKYDHQGIFSLGQESNKIYKVRSSISFYKTFNDSVSVAFKLDVLRCYRNGLNFLGDFIDAQI